MESLDVKFFTQAEIPWDDLAFPVINDVLDEFFADLAEGEFKVRAGLPNYRYRISKQP